MGVIVAYVVILVLCETPQAGAGLVLKVAFAELDCLCRTHREMRLGRTWKNGRQTATVIHSEMECGGAVASYKRREEYGVDIVSTFHIIVSPPCDAIAYRRRGVASV